MESQAKFHRIIIKLHKIIRLGIISEIIVNGKEVLNGGFQSYLKRQKLFQYCLN